MQNANTVVICIQGWRTSKETQEVSRHPAVFFIRFQEINTVSPRSRLDLLSIYFIHKKRIIFTLNGNPFTPTWAHRGKYKQPTSAREKDPGRVKSCPPSSINEISEISHNDEAWVVPHILLWHSFVIILHYATSWGHFVEIKKKYAMQVEC